MFGSDPHDRDPPEPCECRDLPAAVRDLDGVDAATVRAAAAETTPHTATVGDADARTVFEVTALDCRTCEALAETALAAVDGVCNVSASHRTGSVRVDYHPGRTDSDAIAARLDTVGYPPTSRDAAFDNRRSAQWRTARFAAGVLFGLMVLLPYLAVVYPARLDGVYHPAVVTYLQDGLASGAAFPFWVNVTAMAAVVLGFTGKPLFERAYAGLREGTVTPDLAVVAVASGLFGYSFVAAFTGEGTAAVGGGVHFDIVVGLVMAATIARRTGLTLPVAGDTPTETADDRGEVATDGGRKGPE